MQCDFHCDDGISISDPVVLGQLYMIAREAMTNAAKHSGANSVNIRLTGNPDNIMLTVEDNGEGFEEGAIEGLHHRHFGHGNPP